MNLIRFGILLLAIGRTSLAAPGPTPPPAPPPGDRFLFVVDTSSGMANLAKACRQAIFDLIYTGLGGYMQPGDTYGVWTFSDQVQKSRLPVQFWRSNSVELASVASRFLLEQPYQNSSHPEAALATLKPTVQLVRDLVVILLTNGRAPIAGTPFDAAIQAACKQRTAQARKLRQPLLVVLTARGGQWVRWSVHLPGEKLDLPQRVSQPTAVPQPTLQVVSTNSGPTAAPTNPPTSTTQPFSSVVLTPIPPPPLSPLGSTASPTNLAESVEPAALPAASNTLPQQPTADLPSTSAQPVPQPDEPAKLPTQPAESIQPSSPATSRPAQPQPEQPTPDQATLAGSNETVRPPTPPGQTDAALSRPMPPSPWLAPARTAAPPVVLRPKNSAIVATPVQAPAEQAGSAAATALLTRPSGPALSPPGPSSEKVQARELRQPSLGATASAPAPMPPGQPASPRAPRSAIFEPWLMLVIGLGLLLAALIVTVMFLRQVRSRPRQTIISQSLDRTGGSAEWR